MKTITRIFYYLYRIFNTIRFLGFQNTLKIFFISKLKSSIMYLTLFRNKFYFRPKIDIGSYKQPFPTPKCKLLEINLKFLSYLKTNPCCLSTI